MYLVVFPTHRNHLGNRVSIQRKTVLHSLWKRSGTNFAYGRSRKIHGSMIKAISTRLYPPNIAGSATIHQEFYFHEICQKVLYSTHLFEEKKHSIWVIEHSQTFGSFFYTYSPNS